MEAYAALSFEQQVYEGPLGLFVFSTFQNDVRYKLFSQMLPVDRPRTLFDQLEERSGGGRNGEHIHLILAKLTRVHESSLSTIGPISVKLFVQLCRQHSVLSDKNYFFDCTVIPLVQS